MSTEAGVARRYARALFDLIDRDGLEHLQTPLLKLAEAAAHKDVAELLHSTSYPRDIKVGVLSTIVKDLPAELSRLLT
ncbi:MAG: F0F1 ATP synthase subunit delta, partial [Mariprofundales bacterium]|nr:F0F1 ATP synthase subunit delta [Mariprofundales bacterium]